MNSYHVTRILLDLKRESAGKTYGKALWAIMFFF